ncbi:MAG: FAD-binding domain-containing protein [Bacteroidota bacterium]
MRKKINIVWFKRDLRLRDHAPLQAAIKTGLPTILCYFFEPSLMTLPQSEYRHWRFAYESVTDLQKKLDAHQIPLYVFYDEVLPVFDQLSQLYEIKHLFSHQETGLKKTFDRDLKVKAFCKDKGIEWKEYRQDGVFRGLRRRTHWQERWEKDMNESVIQIDLAAIQSTDLPTFFTEKNQDLPPQITQYKEGFQQGGETFAWRYYHSFLTSRIDDYSRFLSKPELSRKSCSRISPYIAYGNISIKEIFQLAEKAKNRKSREHPIENFLSRAWWRSHYIQKLESEWELEFEPLNRGMKALDREVNPSLFEPWAEGRTGFPMIDASIRCLQQIGWLNFRMRATLGTFVTFALWQDWKAAAEVLARLFLDFEPGIHYAQFQMQAGLTGYHTLRIFNPIYQSQVHDVEGKFVKQFVPELRNVPVSLIHKPWEMTTMEQMMYKCRIGIDYPEPIVDYERVIKENKDRYWVVRQSREVRSFLPQIWDRHCLPQNVKEYEGMRENRGS